MMGRTEKEDEECVFCMRKMKRNIQSLKTASSCKTSCTNEKLMSFVSPSAYEKLNDSTVFPDPQVCKSCFNLINRIHRNAIRIENFVGKPLNFQVNSEAAINGKMNISLSSVNFQAPGEKWPNMEQIYKPEEGETSRKSIRQDMKSSHKESPIPIQDEVLPRKCRPSRNAKNKKQYQKMSQDQDSGEETDDYFEKDDISEEKNTLSEVDDEYYEHYDSISQAQETLLEANDKERISLRLMKSKVNSSQSNEIVESSSKETTTIENGVLETEGSPKTKPARKRGKSKKSVKALVQSKKETTKLVISIHNQTTSIHSAPELSERSTVSVKGKELEPAVVAKSTRTRRKKNSDEQITQERNSALPGSEEASSQKEDKESKIDPSGKKPFKCLHPGCHREYAHETSLTEHKFSHENKLPHVCPYADCGKAFFRLRDLKSHIYLHTGEKPFKCEFDGCMKSFRLRNQYYMHRRVHTGERPYKCKYPGCERAFIRGKSLKLHEASHSSELPFCCEECGKRFSHIQYFKLHKLSHKKRQEKPTQPPPEKTLPCEVCGKMFSSKLNVRRHINIVHKGMKQRQPEDKVFVCEINGCNRTFRWKSCMVRHKALKHRKEDYKHQGKLVKYTCPVQGCKEEFNRHKLQREHMAAVHGKQIENGKPKTFKEWMCFDCGMAVTKKQMPRHKDTFHSPASIFNVHEQGINTCMAEQCGMEFRSAEELKSHIPFHVGNPPYTCLKENCKKTFLLKKNLDLHMMLHNNIKPFHCTYDGCDKSFVTQLCLMRHSKEHNNGTYVCPVETCGARFSNLNNAGGHLAGHRGEDPYICGLCGAVFATYNVWSKHKKRHEKAADEKKNKCPKCGKGFSLKSELKRHMPVHSDKKPYICEICGMGYASKAGYSCHLLTHGEKKYFCEIEGCGKSFTLPLTLKRHQAVHEKPTNLCSSCGKILKFSLKKHKCAPSKGLQEARELQQNEPEQIIQIESHPLEMQNSIQHEQKLQLQPLESAPTVIHSQGQMFQSDHQPLQMQEQHAQQTPQIHQLSDTLPLQKQQQLQQLQHQQHQQHQHLHQQQLIQQQLQSIQQQPQQHQQQQLQKPIQQLQLLQQQQQQQQHHQQQQLIQQQQQQQHLSLSQKHQQQNQIQQQQQEQQRNLIPQLHAMLPFQQELQQQPIHHMQPIIMAQGISLPAGPTDVGTGSSSIHNIGGGGGDDNSGRQQQQQHQMISIPPSSSIAMSGLPITNLHIPPNIPFPSIPISFPVTSLPVTSLSTSSIPMSSISNLPALPLANTTPNAAGIASNSQPSVSIPDPSISTPLQSLPQYMKPDFNNSLGNYMVIYDSSNPNGV